MRTIIATGNKNLERYIIGTHQDILILAQTENYELLKAGMKLHKPQLLIFDETILEQQQLPNVWSDLTELSPDTHILWLRQDRELTPEETDRTMSPKHRLLQYPLPNHELSQVLYRIAGTGAGSPASAVVAVWSPKGGDGATLTTDAIAHILSSRGLTTGVFDFNLKAPYLKLRYGLDDSAAIDDLIPFIAGGLITAEMLREHTQEVTSGIFFLGGVRHPELHGRYNATHFNALLEAGRESFSRILVDAGSSLDNMGMITALKNADTILAVMQPNYISKHTLKEYLRLFPACGINPNKVKIVLNRYVPEVFGSPELITAGLNLALAGTLPEIGPEANIISDKSLFEGEQKKVVAYNQSLADLLQANQLCETPEKGRKTALFPKLLARR